MDFLKFLFSSMYDVATTNLDLLGYDVSLAQVMIFVTIGSILISFIFGITD